MLGAGGVVGVSYIVGALGALHDVAGFDASQADLIVGTSAGALVGALLRSGMPSSDLYALAHSDDDPARDAFAPAFSGPIDLARRGVGSACTMARAFGIAAHVGAPDFLRRAFPSGFFTLRDVLDDLSALLDRPWPDRPLYLCACDLETRRRVVFGTPSAPSVPLPVAVQAACAIPGFYENVTIDGHDYVDGGVVSSSNLDLAAGYDLVIGVIPMSYDRTSARPSLHPYRLAVEVFRLYPTRSLRAEMMAVRDSGSRVVVIRPTVFEAQRHGFNLMSVRDRLKVADKARKTVTQSLATGRLAAVLGEFGYGLGRTGSRSA